MADPRLTTPASAAIEAADAVLVSSITFFEITQKVRIGKWPEMEPHIDALPRMLEEQGGSVAELDPVICAAAGIMAWDHRDPFDRLLAATAKHRRLPILSADEVFDEVVTRVW